MLSGYVEKAHISEFQFENQRRTFQSYGYALDPTADDETGSSMAIIGMIYVRLVHKYCILERNYPSAPNASH